MDLRQGNTLISFLFQPYKQILIIAYCDFFSMVIYKHNLQWPNSYKCNERQKSDMVHHAWMDPFQPNHKEKNIKT